MAYESTAEPIKIGDLMDFLLSDDYPQHRQDDLIRSTWSSATHLTGARSTAHRSRLPGVEGLQGDGQSSDRCLKVGRRRISPSLGPTSATMQSPYRKRLSSVSGSRHQRDRF
jgi:hypothetical protein